MSFNRITLMGNVATEPNFRILPNNKRLCNFSLITSEPNKCKQTKVNKAIKQFHTVVVFSDNLCNVVENHLKKGVKTVIEGELQYKENGKSIIAVKDNGIIRI